MHTLSHRLLSAVGALVLAAGLVACDNFEDNLEFEPGDSRTVVGAGSGSVTPAITFTRDTTVVNGDTTVAINNAKVAYTPLVEDYYVQAFTIDQSYTWSVAGPGNPTGATRRDGEFYDVTFTERGTYTVTVSDGTYSGSRTVSVKTPPGIGGCIAQPYDVTEGETVTLNGIVADNRLATTVAVDYGDGTKASNVTLPVQHVYADAGTYTATITVQNADGSASCSVTVEVDEATVTVGV